jgi:outer membrane protein, heavy metal efflux system
MPASSRPLFVRPPLLPAVVGRAPRSALALALCLVLVAPALAGEGPHRSLSSAQYLAEVARSHPSLPLLEAAVEAAGADRRAAGLWQNPVLSYEREEIFTGGEGQPETFLRLELPLELSGRRGLRMEGAELGHEAARASFARARSDLLNDALGVYWSARAAGQVREAMEAERAALAAVLGAARARSSAGDISGYDLDRLELEVEALEDLLADAGLELDGWQRRMGLLLGEPRAPVAAGDALELPGAPAGMDELVARALAARPDHQAARLRVTRAERELAAARRGWVPELVLTGGAKSAAVGGEDTAWGYIAGVALGLPLFDRGQGEAARALAHLRQAQAEQRLLEAQVASEVLTAHGALTRSLAQAARFEQHQLPRLGRLVRRAEVSYTEGERPVFELLDAYRTARGIRLRQVELSLTARLGALELARAVGDAPHVEERMDE